LLEFTAWLVSPFRQLNPHASFAAVRRWGFLLHKRIAYLYGEREWTAHLKKAAPMAALFCLKCKGVF
jgi:hypothetical protein